VKEGESTAGQSFTANVFPGRIAIRHDRRMKLLPPNSAVSAKPNESGYAMIDGRYQSHDSRNLVGEAIIWIEQQVDEVEQNALAAGIAARHFF
jgi:hypothetical protein